MRILYVSHINSYPPDKGEKIHIYHTIKEFSSLGCEVYALGHEKHPDVSNLYEPLSFESLKKIDVVYVRQTNENEVDWTVKLKKIKPSIKVIWEINAPVYELIHVTKLHFSKLGSNYIKKMIRAVQLKLIIANIEYNWSRKRRYCNLVDGVVTVSKTMEKYLSQEVRVPVVGIPNGAVPEFMATPLVGQLDVLLAGSDLPWIDWETPKSVIRNLSKNSNIHFHVIGKNWHIPNVTCYERMTQDQLKQLVKKCHVGLVLYKDYEWCKIGFFGSSLKLFEYMGYGKIVIAVRDGQIAEVVEHGVNGFTVPVYDFHAISDILVKLSNSPDLAESISVNAYETILNNYTWKHSISRYLEFINIL